MTFDETVEAIVGQLSQGAVVIVPTDTVYGLAADPHSAVAMARLFELKQRPRGIAVAILVESIAQAHKLVDAPPVFETLAERHWPGALTIVTVAKPDLGLHIGEVDTLGIRVPDHQLMLECARRFGPIAATSANRHGAPTITSPDRVIAEFGDDVELIVDGGVLDNAASTVISVAVNPPVVLRQGAIEL